MDKMKDIFKLFTASILSKIMYLVFAAVLLNNLSIISLSGYKELIDRNDAGWYRQIAENGYPRTTDEKEIGYHENSCYIQSAWAFFPLYPMMNKMLMTICNIRFEDSAFILSIIFSFLSLFGFYQICKIYVSDKKKAFYISLVFLLFPFHYYFSMMYTEAVFFTFLIYTFLALYYRKYWTVSILLIPLVLVRSNGIIMFIPLYLFFLESEGILSKKHLDIKAVFKREIMLKSLMFSTAPLTFLLYCLYQKQITTHFFAFSIAQAGWGREFMFPFMALFRQGSLQVQFNSFYVIIVMLYAVFIWKRNTWSWNLLIWLSLLFPLCAGSVMSMTRFISVIFPLMLPLGIWFYSKKYINYLFLGLLAILQLMSFYFWIIWHPFSY